jgi:signal transduction histidine kinase
MATGRRPAPPSRRRSGEGQAALRRIAAIAAAGEPPGVVFGTVTAEASALLDGALVALVRFERNGTEAVVLAQTGGHVAVGVRLNTTGDTTLARMRRSGRAERIDDYTNGSGTELIEELGVRAGVSVPVVVDGELWGSLGVSSLAGPLPMSTEHRLAMFAEIIAAVAVSAEARESVRVLADEQAALLRVAALVARGAGEAEIFDAVAVEAAGLINDEPTTLVRYEGDRTFTVLAHRNGPAPIGMTFTVPADDAGSLDQMLRTSKPARLDRHDQIANYSYSEFGVGSSVSVPIVVNGRLWGSLGTLNEGRWLPAETEGRLAKFAELVGSALANVQARAELERFGTEQAALRRVAELVAGAAPHTVVLRAIVAEVIPLFGDVAVSVVRPVPSDTWQLLEADGASATAPPAQVRHPVEETIARQLLVTGQPTRINHLAELSGGSRAIHRESVSSVGVPIRVEGQTWAVLVVSGWYRRLPAETENRLTQFAQIAATAVTSDQSRTALRRLAQEQAALRRVAELVARGAALEEVFESVATEASRILGEAATNLVRYDDDVATVVAVHHGSVPVGLRYPIEDHSASDRLRRNRRPLRLLMPEGASRPDLARDLDVGALVAVPIIVERRVWGLLSTTTPGEPPPADTEDRLGEFAELAAAAIASAENRAELRASRARVVATADETRQRLQRDVHDGAQQRLVQTVLTLKLGVAAANKGEETTELMQEALRHAERATVELRDIVHGLLPAALTRGGLHAGIDSLVATLPIPVDLDTTGLSHARLAGEVEVTAYFVVAEALTNVVKHSRASRARVTAHSAADVLLVEVCDDGVGGADPREGSGLTGLSDRVDALDGTLILESSGETGTTVRVSLPLPGPGRG